MDTLTTNIENIDKVVKGGYCVGCGGCAFISGGAMKVNEYGEYVPDFDPLTPNFDTSQAAKMEFVCPSLNPQYNENVLAETFLTDGDKPSTYIGPHRSVYGGYVKEGEYRNNGTSGGFGTWIGAELFKKGLIDGVIHVKEIKRDNPVGPFSKYGISDTLEEITKGSRTKYHAIETSEVLNLVKQNPGKKYFFIGLPCMVKSIRRVQLADPDIREGIAFTAALVCGHLKSINWTLSLAWGAGIKPDNAVRFKYRTKAEDIPARAYVFTAYSEDSEIREDSSNVIGGKFNQGALMLQACNFCDDVVGETADVTVGDAWLPQFEIDKDGTNLLIIRNAVIEKIITNAGDLGRVHLEELAEKDAIDAQSGGFRMRREGLAFRLKRADLKNKWRPVKRVNPGGDMMPPLRKLIYIIRASVTIKSREIFRKALEQNDYKLYERKMKIQLKILRFLEISSSASRIIRKKIRYIQLRSSKK